MKCRAARKSFSNLYVSDSHPAPPLNSFVPPYAYWNMRLYVIHFYLLLEISMRRSLGNFFIQTTCVCCVRRRIGVNRLFVKPQHIRRAMGVWRDDPCGETASRCKIAFLLSVRCEKRWDTKVLLSHMWWNAPGEDDKFQTLIKPTMQRFLNQVAKWLRFLKMRNL